MILGTKNISVDQAQSLRMQRTIWGFLVQGCTVLVIACLYSIDMIPGPPVLIYLGMIAALDIGTITLLKTGLNLRFKDPSLTVPQIVLASFPIIYIMFHVADPQARIGLLLMGTSSLMFGMFLLERRGMLLVASTILASYLGLLLALFLWAPERINVPVDAVIVLTFAFVLTINAYLASIFSNMRSKLKAQNIELAELAALDPLTRLPNRRSLMTHLAKESARSERRDAGQAGMCVGMLDVDHFKEINDTLGHDMGDTILCGISDALRAALREYDFVGRFGGEEFLIVLPQTSLDDAQALANRICEAIGALRFPDLPPERRVTVSLGVADHRSGERIGETLKRADEALYRAKEGGRNRVAY